MPTLSQEKRLIRIKTPLGEDVFIALSLQGVERVSELFLFKLELLSTEKEIDPAKIVGQDVTISIHYRNSPRYLHGVVSSFQCYGITAEGLREYHATVVPRLWFLTLSGENRIFHNKTTAEIVSDILRNHNVEFQHKAGKYDKRAYCIQYDESDYDFVTRLLAEEGINYYFTHAQDKHTLVLADANAQFYDCEEATVPCNESHQISTDESRVSGWTREYKFHTGKFGFTDYIESKPDKNNEETVTTKTKLKNIDKFSRQFYGSFVPYKREKDLIGHGASFSPKQHAKVHIEASESHYDVAEASSNCCTFGAGGRFTLNHPTLTGESKKYLLTSVTHNARQASNVSGNYQNLFTCIPAEVPLRPAPRTSRKRIDGPHLAVVTGVKATDSGGADPQTMVKVKFQWDSKQASCMVRVAQAYAGKNWGAVFVPRVGQDVIVEFLGGDPDCPLITGAVYNANNVAPPYSKTQSGFKTESSSFNEFRFDDKSGAEEIYMEAGKDHNFLIHNDQTGTIENNQTLTVNVNRDITVKGDETHKIDGNQSLTVKANRDITVKGNETHKIEGNQSDSVTGNITQKSSKNINIEASMAINLKVGGNSIKIDNSGITINGTMVKINGKAMAEVKAGGMLTLQGALTKVN